MKKLFLLLFIGFWGLYSIKAEIPINNFDNKEFVFCTNALDNDQTQGNTSEISDYKGCCDFKINYSIKPTGGCGNFEIYLNGYDDCIIKRFIVRGPGSDIVRVPDSDKKPSAKSYKLITGQTPGANLKYTLLLEVKGCSRRIQTIQIEVPQDGCTDCCNVTPELTANALSCEEVEVCINGYEGCEDTWFKFHAYNHVTGQNIPNTGWSSNNCFTFTGLDDNGIYDFNVSIGLPDDCGGGLDLISINTFRMEEECEVNCCIAPTVDYRPLTSCTAVLVSISPIYDNEEFCEGTTFEYSLCDENGEELIPPFTNGFSNHSFHGLDLCKIYYVKGKINRPGCYNPVYSIEIDTGKSCCDGITEPNEDLENARLITETIDAPLSSINNLTAYPNPFQSNFEISVVSELSENYELFLFDTQGKLIRQQQGQTQKGTNIIEINDLDHLNTGIYIYRLHTGDKMYTSKVTKL